MNCINPGLLYVAFAFGVVAGFGALALVIRQLYRWMDSE